MSIERHTFVADAERPDYCMAGTDLPCAEPRRSVVHESARVREPMTLDRARAIGLQRYQREVPDDQEPVDPLSAVAWGIEFGYREGYRAAIAETASFGQVIAELRHVCSVLETACAREDGGA